jgi:hypothetical protein
VLLADEFVGSRVRLKENGVKRTLGSIVRVEVKLAVYTECARRGCGLDEWEAQATQFGWEQGCGSPLPAPFEKLAPAKTSGVTLLLSTTQSSISRQGRR